MADPPARAPKYLARFRCIGAACEDHCCAGWQTIDVDADTYACYGAVEHPALGPALRRHVVPYAEPSAESDEPALIAMPEGGCCPFFGADRLCSIQRELGEALLPATCDTFPRQATLVDGTIDLAARLSCPEIARLALLAPDALDLEPVEPDRRLRERGQAWVEVPWDELPADDSRRHYHRVRGRCAALLRRADASLEARLRALGGALEQLDLWRPALEAGRVERIFDEADARLPALQRETDAAPPALAPPALVLRRVRSWVAMDGVPPRYRACLDRLRDGLRLPADPAAPLDEPVARAYAAALPRFRAYVREKPWVLAHALLNQVQGGNFPFHPEHRFIEEYALLALRFALLRLHLVGAAAAEGALSDDLVVQTVQAFDKYADTADDRRRGLHLLRREEALTPERLAALVRE